MEQSDIRKILEIFKIGQQISAAEIFENLLSNIEGPLIENKKVELDELTQFDSQGSLILCLF